MFFILMSASSAPALCEEMAVPQWDEFCPEKFINAKVLTPEEYTAQSTLKFIRPTAKMLENHNAKANYWIERKNQFDYFINTCESFPENKRGICYIRARDRELRLNRELEEETKTKLETKNPVPEQQIQQSGGLVQPGGMLQQMTQMMKMFSPQN